MKMRKTVCVITLLVVSRAQLKGRLELKSVLGIFGELDASLSTGSLTSPK